VLKRAGVDLCGHDLADGEEVGTWLRISKQFRKGCSRNFAGTAFYEVRRCTSVCSLPLADSGMEVSLAHGSTPWDEAGYELTVSVV
jgi:hypothetical protein